MNVFDKNVIADLRDMLDDDEILRDSFLAFKNQLNLERKQIHEDIQEKNTPHLAQLIRRIKLEARQFGATPLAEKCRELEARLISDGSGFNDISLRNTQEVLSMMKSVENFIDTKFVTNP